MGAQSGLACRIAGWLSVVALVLWALVPAGVMPVRGADGGIAFALCAGQGALVMGSDAHAGHHPAPDGKVGHKTDLCPFAASHAHSAIAAAGLPPAPVALIAPQAVPTPRALPALGRTPHLRPEGRGPPAVS